MQLYFSPFCVLNEEKIILDKMGRDHAIKNQHTCARQHNYDCDKLFLGFQHLICLSRCSWLSVISYTILGGVCVCVFVCLFCFLDILLLLLFLKEYLV